MTVSSRSSRSSRPRLSHRQTFRSTYFIEANWFTVVNHIYMTAVTDSQMSIIFTWRQFPIRLAFTMTIKKSQFVRHYSKLVITCHNHALGLASLFDSQMFIQIIKVYFFVNVSPLNEFVKNLMVHWLQRSFVLIVVFGMTVPLWW